MSMSEGFDFHQLEVNITDELALAESSRPDEPVVESDRGWRPNPTDVKDYEARLRTLRDALETVEGAMRVRPRSELIEMMHRIGMGDQVAEALRRLPEVVDLDRDGQLLYEMGLSRDQLVDRLGGSAW